jgi:hypothetical protein
VVGAAINPGPYKFLTHGLIQGPQLNAMSESETFNFPPQLTDDEESPDHCARIAFKTYGLKPSAKLSWILGKRQKNARGWNMAVEETWFSSSFVTFRFRFRENGFEIR